MMPPMRIVIERDGLEFTVGIDGDLSWDDLGAIQHINEQHGKQIPARHLQAVIAVLRIFPGSEIQS
jgi:hypothetical protein